MDGLSALKSRRIRRVRRRQAEAFPGEQAWLWHGQIQVERLVSPLRYAALIVTATVWFATAHAPLSKPDFADTIAGITFVYATADLVVVFRFPDAVSRLPWGSTVLDFVLLYAWIFATGGSNSPFVALAFLGVIASSLRLAWRPAALVATAYVSGFVLFAGVQHLLEAFYLSICGAALVLWTAVAQRDRRNSLRDDLTGSFTREYAAFRLNDVYVRDAFPVAVAVVDLDGFKRVNDTHGHAAGDAVLVQTVRVISSAIRQGDLLARSGGDEFILILPRTAIETARIIAERVRTSVAGARFRLRRDLPPLRLTASIGIAVADSADAGRTELIKIADDRLYAAKESGRNRVVV
jgi:diguanylate cyclase (GGDEF)-like protein